MVFIFFTGMCLLNNTTKLIFTYDGATHEILHLKIDVFISLTSLKYDSRGFPLIETGRYKC